MHIMIAIYKATPVIMYHRFSNPYLRYLLTKAEATLHIARFAADSVVHVYYTFELGRPNKTAAIIHRDIRRRAENSRNPAPDIKPSEHLFPLISIK